nr:MAG TPA: hypothetical protein [Caudoviricetes sp.]
MFSMYRFTPFLPDILADHTFNCPPCITGVVVHILPLFYESPILES